jgi:hypothetical protein
MPSNFQTFTSHTCRPTYWQRVQQIHPPVYAPPSVRILVRWILESWEKHCSTASSLAKINGLASIIGEQSLSPYVKEHHHLVGRKKYGLENVSSAIPAEECPIDNSQKSCCECNGIVLLCIDSLVPPSTCVYIMKSFPLSPELQGVLGSGYYGAIWAATPPL